MSDLSALEKQALQEIQGCVDAASLEAVRLKFLGKKGLLTLHLKELGALDERQRTLRGACLNALKESLIKGLQERQTTLKNQALLQKMKGECLDVTLSSVPAPVGRLHPLSAAIEEVTAYFLEKGFQVEEGPHVETDFNNFTALNIPLDHPARQSHDTFYLKGKMGDRMPGVMRTHTSPVQVRALTSQKLPLRMVAVGKVFRADYDATHTPMFHQLEGLVLEEQVHMGHLKRFLKDFLQDFFQVKSVPLRFRPSYFPFVEPGVEVDIRCSWDKGRLNIGEGDAWLEVLGAGMLHPQVLKNCGVNSEVHQGFAFGVGLERLVMLREGVPDLRQFFENDVRWLQHYGADPQTLPSPLYARTPAQRGRREI